MCSNLSAFLFVATVPEVRCYASVPVAQYGGTVVQLGATVPGVEQLFPEFCVMHQFM